MSMDDYMANHKRDVRVTAKVPAPRDFVAPDLSPVGTHATEMAKGEQGWTDTDHKVVVTDPATLARQARIAELRARHESMQCGTPIRRKASQPAKVAVPTGPSAAYREAKLRAARLAALEGTLQDW